MASLIRDVHVLGFLISMSVGFVVYRISSSSVQLPSFTFFNNNLSSPDLSFSKCKCWFTGWNNDAPTTYNNLRR